MLPKYTHIQGLYLKARCRGCKIEVDTRKKEKSNVIINVVEKIEYWPDFNEMA